MKATTGSRIRIAYASDIHEEFDAKRHPVGVDSDGHPTTGPDLRAVRDMKADILVLAGDISLAARLPHYLKACASWLGIPVLALAGNHEFYRAPMDGALELMKTANEHPLVHFLDNDTFVLEKNGQRVRFVCTTLWTDFRLNEKRTGMTQQSAMLTGQMQLNDFRMIFLNGHLMRPEDQVDLHRKAVSFIEEELARPFKGTSVVVTHHAPSGETETKFRQTPLSPCFASDLHHIMTADEAPEWWIHGHSHDDSDVTVGKTHIVSRQRGYPGEKTFEFGIIDIE